MDIVDDPSFMLFSIPEMDVKKYRRKVQDPELSVEDYLTDFMKRQRMITKRTEYVIITADSPVYEQALEALEFQAASDDVAFEVVDRKEALVRLTASDKTETKFLRVVWTPCVPLPDELNVLQ